MTVWNLGSINADHFFDVPRLPRAGETLAATAHSRGLGGKGANMAVASARAGAAVELIGAVGPDGTWMKDRLEGYGVAVRHVAVLDQPAGHAVVAIDPQGENQIIIYPGANLALDAAACIAALDQAQNGDMFVCQNETNAQESVARAARDRGLRIAYAAAPFSVEAVRRMVELTDLLILNQVEADQFAAAIGAGVDSLPVYDVVVTRGGQGCRWFRNGEQRNFLPFAVTAVDTTGAGDTFTGYLLAGLDDGLGMERSITRAQAAAALKVTRRGTADAIPTAEDVAAFQRLYG